MGMFDYIVVDPPQYCSCGTLLEGWQSKDGPCALATIPFWRVDSFYTSCSKCATWHQYDLKVQTPRTLDFYEKTEEEL